MNFNVKHNKLKEYHKEKYDIIYKKEIYYLYLYIYI